jgi:transcription initiation factor IIF auxiliary subunit
MSIRLNNTSKHLRKSGETNWWDWTAFIESDSPDEMDDVQFVEYQLHPSFPNPVRRVFKKEGGFPMEARGWGIFPLRARVVFKTETREPLVLSHMLEFE